MKSLLVFGPLLAGALSYAAATETDEKNRCTYPEDSIIHGGQILQGISWDLSSLGLDSGKWYGARDKNNYDTRHLTFYFNICGTLKKSDISQTAKSEQSFGDSPSPAAWVHNGSNYYQLGAYPSNAHGLTYHLQPHDRLRPAAGVNLWYKAGGVTGFDDCDKDVHADIKIAVLCGSGNRHATEKLEVNRVNNDTFVDKIGKCSYEVHVVDPAGCPHECPIVNGNVCSGNGHCAYDHKAKKAHCFCEKGHKGNDCTKDTNPENTEDSGRSSKAAVGATFGGIFAGLVGMAGFWYYRKRRSGSRRYQPQGDEGFY
eukprot:gb/GECG01015221.1/.p1 GENE.gb/GECG01015221.1/~~gb/GECG01015221.1/.p1  ORF type:complete len:313 (+),score=27.40 gb/GECG01015221.1/:1-939(+)